MDSVDVDNHSTERFLPNGQDAPSVTDNADLSSYIYDDIPGVQAYADDLNAFLTPGALTPSSLSRAEEEEYIDLDADEEEPQQLNDAEGEGKLKTCSICLLFLILL